MATESSNRGNNADMDSNTQRTTRASSQAQKPRTAKQRYDDQLEADAVQKAEKQKQKKKKRKNGTGKGRGKGKASLPTQKKRRLSTVEEDVAAAGSSEEKGLFVSGESEDGDGDGDGDGVIGAGVLGRKIHGGTISSGTSILEEEIDSHTTGNADEDDVLLALSERTGSQRLREQEEDKTKRRAESSVDKDDNNGDDDDNSRGTTPIQTRRRQRSRSQQSSGSPTPPDRVGGFDETTEEAYLSSPLLYTFNLRLRIDIAAGLDKQQAYRQHVWSGWTRRDSHEQDIDGNFIQYVDAERVLDVADHWLRARIGDATPDGDIYAEKYDPDKRFLTVEASYQGLAVRDVFCSNMKKREEVEGICYALRQVDEWFEVFGPRKFYTITLVQKWFPKPLPEGTTPAAPPGRIPRSSQRQTATQQQLQERTDRLRAEATARRAAAEDEGQGQGLDQSDSELLDEDNGDYRGMIKRRWHCKVRACRWYGQCCFYTGLDTRKNHLLITAEVLRPWAKGIRDGTLTVDGPGEAGVSKLWRYKHRNGGDHLPANLYSASARRSSQQVSTSSNGQHIHVHTHTGSGSQRVAGYDEPPSSPVQLNDNSSQLSVDFTPPEDRVKEFFLWLRGKSFWVHRNADVDGIEQKFLDGDYSLKSILKCSHTMWREMGFKEGQ